MLHELGVLQYCVVFFFLSFSFSIQRLVFEFCLKHMNMVEYCLKEDVLFISDGIGTL